MTTSSATSQTSASSTAIRQRETVRNAIAKHTFCTLATASAANRPHVAGVLYAEADGALYVSTMMDSIKARNIRANPNIALTIPVRRLPIGPPSTVQFQGTAEVLPLDDPRIVRLVTQGKLKKVTGHGELELPGGCFLKITPARRAQTYGIGMSLWTFIRNPLNAAGSAELF